MIHHNKFIEEAIDLSAKSIENGGGPFGAVVVKDGKIIGKASNGVTLLNDPTAHAEVLAIREAAKTIQSFDLSGSVIYTSCEPCPMCLGAIYWAGITDVYYANTRYDAAKIGFSDQFIYDELALPVADRQVKLIELRDTKAGEVFQRWTRKTDKTPY